ncbi:MAG TPA: T9SS type A sorting domain-containing protein [Ferruginibacter sp.]|nr:T9SS type A sorting domain-containing protein [Ferruginibacter sp.]
MYASIDIQLIQTSCNPLMHCRIPVNEPVEYRIYNAGGQLVFSKTSFLINPTNTTEEQIDVSRLPPGEYELQIKSRTQSIQHISFNL